MEVTVMPNAASVQKQQGLNQVVINKVQKMIEGKQQSVMGTITRLLEEGKIAQDFIAPIGVNLRHDSEVLQALTYSCTFPRSISGSCRW